MHRADVTAATPQMGNKDGKQYSCHGFLHVGLLKDVVGGMQSAKKQKRQPQGLA